MNIAGVIPARWGSSRFPGKSLAPVGGKPLVQWVLERVAQAKRLSSFAVATDDARIHNFVLGLGYQSVMTREDHPSGTDRVAEAAVALNADAVINIQGDEPLIDPALIDQIAESLTEGSWAMVTAAVPLKEQQELDDSSVVKVVMGEGGRALYFSRAAIPHFRDLPADQVLAEGLHFRHLGIYGYQRDALQRMIEHKPVPLEEAEKLEQLRALHLGLPMQVLISEGNGPGVDTPQDVLVAEQALRDAGLIG